MRVAPLSHRRVSILQMWTGDPASARQPARPVPARELHRRRVMSYRPVVAVVALSTLLTLACGSSTGPSAPVRVGLTVNGAPLGSVSCDGAIVIATSATNLSAEPIDVQRLAVRFTPQSGACAAHTAPISPDLAVRLAGGATAELRRFDAAGTLCQPPDGRGTCSWTATAELATSAGPAADAIGFATFRSASEGCEGVAAPRLLAPDGGAVLSGTVNVQATVVESASCVISARTVVEAFSAHGEPAFVSSNLDLGDHYPWDTRRFRNGQYWLSAYQSCCGLRSAPIVVTVQN